MRTTLVLFTTPLVACRFEPLQMATVDLAPQFGEEVHGLVWPLIPITWTFTEEFDPYEGLPLETGEFHVSDRFEWNRPFDEVLVSWCATVPTGAGLVVEVQVDGGWLLDPGPTEDRRRTRETSPWLYLGGWGEPLPVEERTVEFEGGRVAVDVLQCDRPFRAFRVRLSAIGITDEPVVVHWASACLTDRSVLAELDPGEPPVGGSVLEVPAISQRSAPPELAPRICSPTSVAMVLAYHGVDAPLEELAASIYDADHDIYGNWPRAVQAAYDHGAFGFLVRLSSWRAVEHFLEAGVPLVVSVGVEDGALRGAPYEETAGHLIVLTGFDADGRVLVNDPAAEEASGVPREYYAEDLERCWMRRGGVAYAIGTREDP